MSTLAWIPWFALAFGANGQDRPPVRLKIGDAVSVSSPIAAYGGSFGILEDGSIYGRFGRVTLEGKTISEAEKTIREALSPFVKKDLVFVTVASLRADVIYLGTKGATPLVPGQNLRQILATMGTEDADRQEIQVFRGGKKILSTPLDKVMSENSSEGGFLPKPDDVLYLYPIPNIRIWLMGKLAKTGETKVNAGVDVYQAIAQNGGFTDPELTDPELKILIRRGPETFEVPLRSDPTKLGPKLENGDVITVVGAQVRKFTITGEVGSPGEYTTRGAKHITEVLPLAGGVLPTGTLTRIMVYRQGELLQLDASEPIAGGPLPNFEVMQGDLIYVRRKENAFYVLGQVASPGKFMMDDRKKYTMTDAFSMANGLGSKGTMRRVRIGRPGPDGRLVIFEFNLDEYLKSGKIESNPEIKPGDVVLFGEPKGVTLGSVSQLLGSFLLVDSMVKK